jgi:hypothetical protein
MHIPIGSTLLRLLGPNSSLFLALQEAIRINMEGLLQIEALLVELTTIQQKETFLVKSCQHLKQENSLDL